MSDVPIPDEWHWRAKTFVTRLPRMMYEHRDQDPLTRRQFAFRMARHAGAGLVIVAGSLAVGMWGYHRFAQLEWIDAFVNAAMLLGGMGPVGEIRTQAGKLFAGVYALYCGMVFLVLIATLLAPIIHRLMHRFHWDADRKRATAGRRKLE